MNELFKGIAINTNKPVYGNSVSYMDDFTVNIIIGNSIYDNSPKVEIYPYSLQMNIGIYLGSPENKQYLYTYDKIKGKYNKKLVEGVVIKSKYNDDYGILVNNKFIPLYAIKHKKICVQISLQKYLYFLLLIYIY